MDAEIIYNDKHKEFMEREKIELNKIYSENLDKQTLSFYFISGLLKTVPGSIKLKPDINNSWYNYKLEVTYKDHVFNLGVDYKGKLNIWSTELYRFHDSTIYNDIIDQYKKENKPLSFTFFKLTTKKLLSVFEYYIKLIDLSKDQSNIKEIKNLKTYEDKKELISFIADALNLGVKETIKEGNYKEFFCYAPFGLIEVKYEFNRKDINFSYEIDKYIEIINKVKERFKNDS